MWLGAPPVEDTKVILFDMLSEPSRNASLRRMVATDRPAATDVLYLLLDACVLHGPSHPLSALRGCDDRCASAPPPSCSAHHRRALPLSAASRDAPRHSYFSPRPSSLRRGNPIVRPSTMLFSPIRNPNPDGPRTLGAVKTAITWDSVRHMMMRRRGTTAAAAASCCSSTSPSPRLSLAQVMAESLPGFMSHVDVVLHSPNHGIFTFKARACTSERALITATLLLTPTTRRLPPAPRRVCCCCSCLPLLTHNGRALPLACR